MVWKITSLIPKGRSILNKSFRSIPLVQKAQFSMSSYFNKASPKQTKTSETQLTTKKYMKEEDEDLEDEYEFSMIDYFINKFVLYLY